jgi:hypothetical protein
MQRFAERETPSSAYMYIEAKTPVMRISQGILDASGEG